MRRFKRKDKEAAKFEFKPIQCVVCDKIFAARSTLQLQREILHEGNNLNDVTLAVKENEVKINKSIPNNDFQVIKIKNEDNSLDTIQRQIDFRDVTLACDDKQIQTHKSILLDLRVQFENYHHHHQDYPHIQVRGEYQNSHFDKQADNFWLEIRSVFWTQVKVEYKIQRKSPTMKNQNKIFDTF